MWIAFIKWMGIICLIYHFQRLHYFEMCLLLYNFFILIFNRESHGVVFISTNGKRLQSQVYGQTKTKLMDTSGSGKSSLFERVDLSLYRFLSSFSKCKQYSDPKLSLSLNLGLIWHNFVKFFACLIYTHSC